MSNMPTTFEWPRRGRERAGGLSRAAGLVLVCAAGSALAPGTQAVASAAGVSWGLYAQPGGAAEEPYERARPRDADGAPFRVSEFELRFDRDHPGHPQLDELMNLEFELLQTSRGFVAPRPGFPTVRLTLEQIAAQPPRVFHASAILAISRELVREFNRRGLVGVFIAPDELDLRTGADGRSTDEDPITLAIFTAIVTDVRSMASGERIDPDDRINNEKHRRIRERSPVRADSDDPERSLVRRDQLDEYAMRLNRHPGRRVDVALAPGEDTGEAVVDYLVQESKPWSVYFQLSNTGTKQTGEWRQRFGFVHNQLTNRDDILTIDYITAGFEDSHLVTGSYEAPLFDLERWRWRVHGSWNDFTASDVGLADERFTGDGYSAGGDVIWNIYQDGTFFVDAVAGGRFQHISVENELTQVSGDADLFLPRIGLEVESFQETSTLSGSVYVEAGLGEDEDELQRLGRLFPDDDWIVLRWDTRYSFYLEPILNRRAWEDPSTPRSSTLAHELSFALRGQYAFDQRLIPNAQHVAGGLYSVRGYRESEVAGDSAVVASAEYRFHLPRVFAIEPEPRFEVFGRPFKVAPQQAYGRPDWDLIFRGFVDAARTINSDRLDFEEDQTLVGAGVGAELLVYRNFSARADWGWAMTDGRETDSGDNRFHFVMTVLY